MEKEIEVAVDWWGNQLGSRNQDAGDVHLNGMMQVFHCADAPTKEQKQKFKEALRAQLTEDDRKHGFGLSVDYDPCAYLYNAAQEAGYAITNGSFPVKTRMYVESGKVDLSAGYGAPYMPIYISEERGATELDRLYQHIEAVKKAMEVI